MESDFQATDLLEAVPDAIVLVDRSGRIVLVNAQTETLFGYTRGELLGKPVEVLLPERFRARHVKHRAQFFDAPRRRPMDAGLELFGCHRDGNVFPVEVSLGPVQTDDGPLVLSTIRDCTMRRQIEQGLTGILEASLNEIYVFDAESLRFLRVNEGARRNLGYTIEELRELTPIDLKPGFTAESFLELLAPLRDGTKDTIVFVSSHKRKDGSVYPVEVHLQCMNFGSSPVFVAVILDITARKQAEDALRESHDQLAQRVRERTLELQQAKQEAERANATKSRFLAAASHDLRQPLQSSLMYLSVLTQQLDQPGQREIGAKLRKTLDVMVELLDALLDMSRLETGSMVPARRDFNLQNLLDRVITDNLPQARAKGLGLDCIGADRIVYTDPALLERIIENLVANAIRYTDHGEVSIDCRRSGEYVRIAVRDSGIGIAESQLERIFEAYYQIDNDPRERSRGLGLGLATVKYVADLLAHPVHVTSKPGEGSTFAVDVPVGHAETMHVDPSAVFARSDTGGRDPVVLLVDDDPAIIDASTMLLQSAGLDVHSALNGDEALAQISTGLVPDIVVCDYRLVDGDGVDIIRRVREIAAGEIPSVIMTGDTSLKDIEAARLSNCTIVHKPVDTDRLVSLIRMLADH